MYSFVSISPDFGKKSLLSDFNAEDTELSLSECLEEYGARHIVEEKTCFKNPKSTAQKMKLSITDFFSKCDQIRRKLRFGHIY